LRISASARTIQPSPAPAAQRRRQPDHAVTSTADRLLQHGFHSSLAIGQCAQQHRQADPGDTFDTTRRKQLEGQVARRGAKDIGHHQDAFASVHLLQQQARQRQDVERVVLRRNTKLRDQRRPLVEHVTDVLNEALAEGPVRHQKYTDHCSILCDRPPF
jgi:hypothetical protein